jgi:hypothetical protein
MRKHLIAMACATITSAALGADIGISINIGQPGFYGQINIGGIPQPPPLIYTQPVVAVPPPAAVYVEEPMYLHVPSGYERHWSRHCGEYNACGRRVYFVRDDWYQREYVPHYQRGEWGHEREEYREHGDKGHGHDWDHDHDHEHEHEHDHGHDHDRDH